MSDHRVVLVPGWQGSGPDHWQSVWQNEHPEYQRVEQRDWFNPIVPDWVRGLHEVIVSPGASLSRPAILVAHSLGCLTVAWWARLFPQDAARVAAALLVAPPDLETPRCRASSLRWFDPAPRQRLPFRSVLVASEDDPYMALTPARQLADAWGARFVNAGAAGHINADSGFGRWPQGKKLLGAMVAAAGYHQIHGPVAPLTPFVRMPSTQEEHFA